MSFLTRVPVGSPEFASSDAARSMPWFPAVGGLLGLVIAAVYVSGRAAFSPFVAAALAVGLGLLLTGALHEDGLADVADALGGWIVQDRLRILADPAHGTYGVAAITLSVLVRVGALTALDGWTAVVVLPAAHAMSRAAAVWLLSMAKPATQEGLGACYVAHTSRLNGIVTAGSGFVIGLILLRIWVVPVVLFTGLWLWWVSRWSSRTIGGITGDVLGATQQGVEIMVMLVGVAAATAGWLPLAWP